MTRRMSQRARAQEIFREMAEADSISAITPTPDPSPQGGGESESAELTLTARVRALYENSAVPVREIARLAGITERTLYKYARKGGWMPRYAWADSWADSWADAGGAARRRRRAGAADFAPVKGVGGRFIRREDKGKPFARGLKATDAAGAARATAACAQAEAVAEQAQADAAFELWNESFIDWLRTFRMIDDELAVYRRKRQQWQPGTPMPEADAREQTLNRLGHIALDGLEYCQRQIAAMLPSYLASIGKSWARSGAPVNS